MIYCSGKDISHRLCFAWHLNSSLCVVCVTFAEFVQRGAVPMVCIEYTSKYLLGELRNIVAHKGQGILGNGAFVMRHGLYEQLTKGCWRSLTMTASAAFHAKGAETVCHPWNCIAASALQVDRCCSCKESSAGSVKD